MTFNYISATPGTFETAQIECIRKYGSFEYFTVRTGKAKYHFVTLSDSSCGLYYAFRLNKSCLCSRRALEPTDEIRLYPIPGAWKMPAKPGKGGRRSDARHMAKCNNYTLYYCKMYRNVHYSCSICKLIKNRRRKWLIKFVDMI